MPEEPRARAIRIEDVAAAAGVSRTTASDALNGTGRVSAATRSLVEKTARELGFRANHHARMLRGGRSRILGFVNSLVATGASQNGDSSPARQGAIDDVDLEGAEYFTALLTSTSTAALSHGYGVILLPPGPDVRSFDPMVADGVILHDPVKGSEIAADLAARGVPVVTTGRFPDRSNERNTWVDSDIAGAAREALEHMYELGARRVALVSNPPIRSYTIDTIDVYEQWVQERGLESQVIFTEARASESTAYRATYDRFAGTEPPDAIFAPVDRLAVGSMHAAKENGLSVPEDVLIAAGSDGERARAADPPVTAIEHDTHEIGHRAVELLIERVENTGLEPEHVIVQSTLRPRRSTDRG